VDELDDVAWLYRGVPRESAEVNDVLAISEVQPPRPARIGERWRHSHVMLNDTETGYTSWTTDRSLAEAAAEATADAPGLSGEVVIFKVWVASLQRERVFPGREDEDEWLIEGTVEDVVLSDGNEEDEEDEDG
jgi:hypothetical protein